MKTIMKTTSSFLKSIDIYGSKVEINFQKQQTFKTVFGGLFTVIIAVLFSLTVWFFGQELYLRQNPTVIGQERYVFQAKRIDINKNNLVIMMGVADSNTKPFIDPTIYTVSAVQQQLVITYNSTTGLNQRQLVSTNKEVKVCDINDFGIPEIKSYFTQFQYQQYYCFAEQELYMEGDFDSDAFSQVYVYVQRCQNSTSSSIICKPPDVITQALEFTKFQYYISDKIVNPVEFKNPFTAQGINLYAPTSISFPQEVQLYFTNYYVESDTGLITESIETKQSFIFSNQETLSYFSNPNVLVRTLFRIQKQKENLVQRKYRKLADVIALVGGFLKVLTTVGAVVSYPFSKFCLNKAIIDEIFNFDFSDDNSGSKQTQKVASGDQTIQDSGDSGDKKKKQLTSNKNTSSKLNETLNIINNEYPGSQRELDSFQKNKRGHSKSVQMKKKSKDQPTDSPSQVQLQSPSMKIQTVTNKKQSILDMARGLFQTTKRIIKYQFKDKFYHVFIPKFNSNKEKAKLVEEGIKKIVNHLDILFFMNKINEIDKLKNILLDADQLKLFEFIPKPIISCTNKPSIQQITSSNPENLKRMYTLFKKDNTDEEKAIEAFQGLTNIVGKEKRSKIDYALMDLVDPSIVFQIIAKLDDNRKSVVQNNTFIMDIIAKSQVQGDEKGSDVYMLQQFKDTDQSFVKTDNLVKKNITQTSMFLKQNTNYSLVQQLQLLQAHNKTALPNDVAEELQQSSYDNLGINSFILSEKCLKNEVATPQHLNEFKNKFFDKNNFTSQESKSERNRMKDN